MSEQRRSEVLPDYLEYERVIGELRKEFPNFKMAQKSESYLMKAIDVFLKVITFWRMHDFMTNSATTVGNTVYLSASWPTRSLYGRCATLRHEAVHMRQRRRYGSFVYAVLYLFWLPAVFAFARRDMERQAYAETMRSYAEYLGIEVLSSPKFRDYIIGQFSAATYIWMWPFRKSNESWYDGVAERLKGPRQSPDAKA